MKEIIEKLIAAVPAFVRQLIGLLSGPKTFIARLDFDSPDALSDALTFIAVSFGVSFLLGIPLLQEKQNKELTFGVLAAQAALGLLLTIAITVIAWKAVGGKFDWKKFIIAICYFSGISTLVWAALELIGIGAAKMIDPPHYQQLMRGDTGVDPSELIHSAAFAIFAGMVCVGLVVVFTWSFCVWAAYRTMAGVSKTRSGIAFVIFALLSPLVLGIQGLMSGATSSVTYHRNPPLPNNLVGEWEMQRESDAGGTHQLRKVFYRFYPDGYYIVDITRYATGNCVKVVAENVVGFAGADGHSLTLIQKTHTRETKDSCSGQDTKANEELSSNVYQYRIDEQPVGWQLCLSDRFGETCYAPRKE